MRITTSDFVFKTLPIFQHRRWNLTYLKSVFRSVTSLAEHERNGWMWQISVVFIRPDRRLLINRKRQGGGGGGRRRRETASVDGPTCRRRHRHVNFVESHRRSRPCKVSKSVAAVMGRAANGRWRGLECPPLGADWYPGGSEAGLIATRGARPDCFLINPSTFIPC